MSHIPFTSRDGRALCVVMRTTVPIVLAIVTSSFLLLSLSSTLGWGATFTWNGGGADNNWTTGANWVGGVAPTGLATDDLVFSGAVRLTPVNNFPAGTNFGSITFSAGGFTLGGSQILLNGNITSTTGTNTIDLAIALSTTPTVTVTGGLPLMLNGTISGSFGLVKAGTGQLFVFGTNTYTGTTLINAGSLKAGANNALGTSEGGTTVASGATLDIGNVTYTTAEPVTINGAGTSPFGALRNGGAGASSFAGPITLASASRIGTGNTGALTLAGTINTGGFTLEFQPSTSPITVNGVISGSGSVVDLAGSTLVVSAVNTYSGATTINGLLRVTSNGALGTAAAGTTVTGDAARLEFIGGVNYTTPEPVTINGIGGTVGAIHNVSGTNSFTGPVTLGSSSSIGASAGSLTLSGGIGGGFELTKVGAGSLKLLGVGTYTGTTWVNAGTLTAAANNALGTVASGTIVADGASLAFSSDVTYGAPEAVSINGAGAGGIGAITNESGTNSFAGPITLLSASTIGSSGLQFTLSGSISNDGWPLTFNGIGSTTVTGAIAGGGPLTKTAVSLTLTLAAANTYGGLTSVTGGTLLVTSDNALGTTAAGTVVTGPGSTLAFSGGVAYAAVEAVTINGSGFGGIGAIQNASGTNSFAGPITLGSASTINSAAGTLTLSNSIDIGTFALTFGGAGAVTANGPITNTGSLVKNGAGPLTLAGANTYSGGTTVNAGALLVDGAAAAITVNSGARLGGTGGTVGAITVAGSGVVSPGATASGTGILNSGNASFVASSSFEVQLNNTVAGTDHDQLNVTGTVNLGGCALVGSVGFTPAGQTMTIINNDNGGDLVAGAFGGLPDGSAFTLGGFRFRVSYNGGDGNDVTLTHLPAPVIVSAVDIPDDQGGWLRLTFLHASLDVANGSPPIATYGIWRQIPVPGMFPSGAGNANPSAVFGARLDAPSTEPVRAAVPEGLDVREVEGRFYLTGSGPQAAGIAAEFPPGTWELVASVPALQQAQYVVAVPTISNAAPNDFVVTAHTTTPSTWYVSDPASGQSVDNLAPARPTQLAAAYANGQTNLQWAANAEHDLGSYRLYRGSSADFTPGSANHIATVTSTSYADVGPAGGYYKLSAVDVNGNESGFALITTGTTGVAEEPVAFALEGVRPNPATGRGLHVVFSLPLGVAARLELLDVSGRRVMEREVGSLGVGRHTVNLAEGRRVTPGLYWVRLTQGANDRRTRVAVID